MNKIIELFQNPNVWAAALGIVVFLRGLGTVFTELGKLNEEEDWVDSVGGFLTSLATSIGNLLNYFGIGNNK